MASVLRQCALCLQKILNEFKRLERSFGRSYHGWPVYLRHSSTVGRCFDFSCNGFAAAIGMAAKQRVD